MKKLAFVIIVILFWTSCSPLKKMSENVNLINYRAVPEVLVSKGNMVNVRIEITFPANYFDPNVTLEITPVITFDGGKIPLRTQKFQGEKVLSNNMVIPFVSGRTIIYTDAVRYTDDMRVSQLYIYGMVSKGKTERALNPIHIARGVLSTEAILDMTPRLSIAKDKYIQVKEDSKEAKIMYDVNSANVKNSYNTSKSIRSLEEFIKKAQKEDGVTIKGVEVRSYASPEGNLNFNKRLSENRKSSSEIFLRKKLDQNNVWQHKKGGFLKRYVVAEDWDGFKKALQESDILDKDLILRVLSMYEDPEIREKEMRNISSVFSEITEKILPKLRRSRLIVKTEKMGKSDEEIVTKAIENPSLLNVEELLYAAGFFDYNEPKMKIYKEALNRYPNDWRVHNNLGVVYFELGNYDKSFKHLKIAAENTEASKDVLNNLGALALKKGDIENAKVFFGLVPSNKDVRVNMGIMSIMEGKYTDASKYLEGSNNVNEALVDILQNKLPQAEAKLDKMEKTDLVYYLKAVVAARNNQKSAVFRNLGDACRINPKLKKVVATDIEFKDYFGHSLFEQIVK